MATEELQEVVEDVRDLAKESAELLEDTESWVLKSTASPRARLILTATLAFASGLGVGILLVKKRTEKRYQELAEVEIAEVRDRFTVPRVMPDEDKPSLNELAEGAERQAIQEQQAVSEQISNENGYVSYDRVETVTEVVEPRHEEVVVQRNVFESDDPERYWDWDEEQERREEHPNDPYLLTREEYDANDTDYDNITLTFFDGDDVLADSQGVIVDNVDNIVGESNLYRFGHASEDPNIVYIRNNRMEVDYEVLKSNGKYAKEVLGFDDELAHSDTRRPRRMRNRDE